MGRHKPARPVPSWLITAAVTVAVAALVVATVFMTRQGDAKTGSAGTFAAPCERTVRVATTSSFTPVLDALASRLARGPDCVQVEIQPAEGRGATSRVGQADVWIPDDTAWVGISGGTRFAARGTIGSETTLATSPIFMVAHRPVTERITAAGGSWLALARMLRDGAGVRLVVRDPVASGDGLIAAGAVGEAVWLDKGMNASSLALAKAQRTARTVSDATPALPNRPDEVGLIPEYALLPAMSRLDDDVTFLAGTDHTAMLRFTWLPMAAAAADAERSTGLTRLLAELTGPTGTGAIQAAGLRPSNAGAPDTAAANLLPPLTAPPFGVLQPHHVDHVFATWSAGDRQTNLLIVTDVSDSMAEPAGRTATSRIDLVRQACRSVGELLPDDAQLGLWEFGANLDPPRDYRTLLPNARLTDSQRRGMERAVDALAPRRTGSGLYDTILDAYQSVRDNYQPDIPNQVLLFTDGRNEKAAHSLTIDQLTRRLAAARDPARPVRLTVVTFGPQAEPEQLKAAVKPVGGYVEPLDAVEDVEAAFIHATAGGLHTS